MAGANTNALLSGPGTMLFSAAVFGFFGFFLALPELDAQTGEVIPLVASLKWLLRGCAVAFLVSALVAMANGRAGEVLYAVVGLISAVGFLGIAAWDIGSEYSALGMSAGWFLLVIFAAWNGYGSLTALRAMRAVRAPEATEASS